MQRPDDLGMLRPGYLDDIVLVNGDPLKDLSILTNPAEGVKEALAAAAH